MGNEERGGVVEGEGGVVGAENGLRSRWRMILPLAEAATAITDSGRPVLRTIRSKLVGSIGGYDEASSLMVASMMDLTDGNGGMV